MSFYDGTKLLSLMDINGDKPEVYLVTTNRAGGKTVYFSRYIVKKFLESGEKFMLLYRYKYELDGVSAKFFKDIGNLFFDGMIMEDKPCSKNTFRELYLDGKPCGYACALNTADTLKKMAHLFSDVKRIFFDEFMSETDNYCSDEVSKLYSIHMSVARGDGKQVRYVPVYMCANSVSLLNPYYLALDVAHRISNKTKFIRGEGFVLEQGFVESACTAQKESGFNKAFAKCKYGLFGAEGVYLNDNASFVEKVSGKNRYVATIRFEGTNYGIRDYYEQEVLYVDKHPDLTCPYKITVNSVDHQVDYQLLDRGSFFIVLLRSKFKTGQFRFKDLECKRALMYAMAYDY